MFGVRLADDYVDPQTGALLPLAVATSNGPAFKGAGFLRFGTKVRPQPVLPSNRTRGMPLAVRGFPRETQRFPSCRL
jgi:hypothetical protein